MTKSLKGTIKGNMVILSEPANLPDQTEVTIDIAPINQGSDAKVLLKILEKFKKMKNQGEWDEISNLIYESRTISDLKSNLL